jgi:hypothetical protein
MNCSSTQAKMRSAAWPDTYRLTTTQGNLVIAIKALGQLPQQHRLSVIGNTDIVGDSWLDPS